MMRRREGRQRECRSGRDHANRIRQTWIKQPGRGFRWHNGSVLFDLLSRLPVEPFEIARDVNRWRPHLKTAKLGFIMRRMAERGVRFIQLYHQGWDHHGGLPEGIKAQTRNTDRASAALEPPIEPFREARG